jgi:phage tail sheath protein FI
MPSFQRPDVYVQEVLPRQYVEQGVASDAQPAMIGVCSRGPALPTLVNNWSDFTKQYGSFDSSPYLSFGAFQYFANGGGPLLVQRSFGTATAVAATRTLNDNAGAPLPTLTVTASSPGSWGNSLYVTVVANTTTGKFDLVVKFGGTSDGYIVERFTNLSMVSTDSRYAPVYVATYSTYIVLTDLQNATSTLLKIPASQTDSALATGADGTAATSSDTIAAFHKLDGYLQPLVVALPGITDNTTLTDVLTSAAASAKNFIILDTPAYTNTAAYLSYTAALPVTDYSAVYGPWVKVNDPSKTTVSSLKLIPASGAVLGRFASTDVHAGVARTPAGINEGRLAGVVDVEVLFSSTDLDSLNSNPAPVNVIRPLPNRGVCIMGGRTLSNSTATRYVSNRRSLIYIRHGLQDLLQFAVFEANDADLWDTLTQKCTRFLSEFRGRGGLAGATDSSAFYVHCDASTNPALAIQNGEVHVEVGVALEYPAEFVVVRLGLFEGGATATESK